jgi:hypothetical protein
MKTCLILAAILMLCGCAIPIPATSLPNGGGSVMEHVDKGVEIVRSEPVQSVIRGLPFGDWVAFGVLALTNIYTEWRRRVLSGRLQDALIRIPPKP